ncbi:hypothetical protein FPRO05_07343 [Fusarium proliferatum]|uniref:Uncharacterized protein n=1 Tax=Gibberella intermedia TaxID=948311 RepID=A0A365MKH2_GIBIN|nr:hypothetical protein FPRO05_07343 [Fusarium proliferatum]
MVAAGASTGTLSAAIMGLIYEALKLPLFPYKRQRNRILMVAMNIIYAIGTILAAYGGTRNTSMPENVNNDAMDKTGNIIMFLVMIGTLIWLYPAGKHIYYARQDVSYRSAEVMMMAAAPATVLQLIRMNYDLIYSFTHIAILHPTTEAALLKAPKEARLEIIEELLEDAIHANLLNGNEQTTLSQATELGFQEIVTKLLHRGASVDKQDAKGQTLLCRASVGGNVRTMSLLLSNGADVESLDENGWTPLTVAADMGYEEVVALLLKHGADPNTRDMNDFTAPLLAAMMGHLGIVERLLDAGTDPNAQESAENLTAISWATRNAHKDVVELLLERGADPNVDGRVILSALIGCKPEDFRGSDTLTEMLVENGADVFVDRWSDERPLVIAARSVRQEHIWDGITVAAEEGDETIMASLMKHCEMNETEKQIKWAWVQESQFGDSLELLRPYFEPDATRDNGGN